MGTCSRKCNAGGCAGMPLQRSVRHWLQSGSHATLDACAMRLQTGASGASSCSAALSCPVMDQARERSGSPERAWRPGGLLRMGVFGCKIQFGHSGHSRLLHRARDLLLQLLNVGLQLLAARLCITVGHSHSVQQ